MVYHGRRRNSIQLATAGLSVPLQVHLIILQINITLFISCTRRCSNQCQECKYVNLFVVYTTLVTNIVELKYPAYISSHISGLVEWKNNRQKNTVTSVFARGYTNK